MNILENCNFGYEVLNELFFKKKIMEPDKAINYAISKLKSDLSADKVMKVSTKVDKAVEGTQKYKDFVEGDLNKLAISQISFKTMIAQKMDLAVGVYEIDDENDCKRIIHYFANNFLFSEYVHIHPYGYHTSLGYDKNFAYIYLCKGEKEVNDMITDNMYITEEEYIAGPKIDKSGVGGAMTMLDKHAGEISIVSGDMMDAEMKHRLEQFDKEQVKAILESKNIVQAYNDFLDLKINKVVNLTEKDFEDAPFIFKSFKQSYDQFKTLEEVDEQYDTKKIIDGFTYQSQDPKFIRALLETRLQYANTTQKLLKKIIENNAKFLKISSAQLQAMISSSSPKNIKDMKDAIAKNEKEFIKNKYLADCRSIGAGVLITGKEFEIGSDKVKFEDYIQDLCNFDLVVLAHGSNSVYSPGAEKQLVERVKNKLKAAGVTNTAKYDLINKKSKEAMLKGQMPELTKDEEEYVNKVSELVDDKVIGDFGKSRKDDKWEFSYPIIFVDGKHYVNIENFIRAAKKQGFKKIKLYSCNPGSYDLPADIKAGVVFSKRTNYLETTFAKDYEVAENSYLEGVFRLEELARQLCEENDIDYNDDKYLLECMNYFEENKEFITEGLISTALGKLVEICKTIIGAIVGFIKKIAGMIAGLIRKIAEFIKGKDQRKIKNTDVEVNTITLETAKLKKTKVHSQQELYKVVESDLNNAAKEYRKVAQKQAQINKQLQQQLESEARKQEQNESCFWFL